MSENVNDGGAAFPGFSHTSGHGACKRNAQGDWENYEAGMTLRDWFAGMAMQGMLAANAPAMDEVNDKNVDAVIAREAYASADAMIIERARAYAKPA